jgi:hypothetical protein
LQLAGSMKKDPPQMGLAAKHFKKQGPDVQVGG